MATKALFMIRSELSITLRFAFSLSINYCAYVSYTFPHHTSADKMNQTSRLESSEPFIYN